MTDRQTDQQTGWHGGFAKESFPIIGEICCFSGHQGVQQKKQPIPSEIKSGLQDK